MKRLFFAIVSVALLAPAMIFAQERTDLARDIFVETSPTNMLLHATVQSSEPAILAVYLLAEDPGKHTLLCFVNEALFSQQKMNLPDVFRLSLHGLARGQHRITLQVVDRQSRIGSVTLNVAGQE